MPVNTATKVDLPAPLRPTSALDSPAAMATDTSRSAWLPPNRFETPIASATGGRPTDPVASPNPLTATNPGRGTSAARYWTWLPQRLGSSTFSIVTNGAGRRSIGFPLKITTSLL
jgi:hypothetical protein